MKKELVNLICCPICKQDLELTISRGDGKEVIKGTLFCNNCKLMFQIIDGIPNLLPNK